MKIAKFKIVKFKRLKIYDTKTKLLKNLVKMDWKFIGTVTLEVLLAVGTGVAVFMGIEKACGSSNNDNCNRNNANNNEPHRDSSIESVNGGNNESVRVCENSNESKIISGLRATQNTCGKILTLVQTATQVAECVSKIFGKNDSCNQPYYNSQPWMYGGGYCQQCNGGTLTRITPFIIEANGSPMQQRYPF